MQNQRNIEYFTNDNTGLVLQSSSLSKASLFDTEPSFEFSFDNRKVTKEFVPKMKELRSEKSRSVLTSNLNRKINLMASQNSKHKI